MQQKYKHIFFDLDHTLWDFEKNSEETLVHLYHHYGLKDYNVTHPDIFVETYRRINHAMWALYNKGLIDKDTLRRNRFIDAFAELGVEMAHIPHDIWELYLQICPTKTNLFPHAIEVLQHLHGRYSISIITNGFEETQHRKIQHCGIGPYISHIITSESAGYAKPDARIFYRLVELNKGKTYDTLMIGDSIDADINGAKAAGIDHVFFNPDKIPHNQTIQTEIHSLHTLIEML